MERLKAKMDLDPAGEEKATEVIQVMFGSMGIDLGSGDERSRKPPGSVQP